LLSSNRNEIKNRRTSLHSLIISVHKNKWPMASAFRKYIIKNNRTGKYFPVVIRQIACQTFFILTEPLGKRDVLS